MILHKNKYLKRCMSALLICCMVFSMAPASAVVYEPDADLGYDGTYIEPSVREPETRPEGSGVDEANADEDGEEPPDATEDETQTEDEQEQDEQDSEAGAALFDMTQFAGVGADALLGADIYVSAAGSDDNEGSVLNPLASLSAAYTLVEDGGTIYVSGDITLEKKIVFGDNKEVTLKGLNDASITYTGTDHIESGRDAFFYVKSGTLEILDITIRLPEQRQTNGSVMYIAKDAAVTLGNGAVISGGYISYAGGGGIYIDGGSLTMDAGAAIKNNYIANNGAAYGGGVYVASGSFLMRGGSIGENTIHTVNNAESFGGGVAVGANGMFIMTGGSITGNAVDTAGGGLYVVPGGTVQMRGQITIDGNTLYNGSTNNVFLPDESEAIELIGSATGKIGLTSGNPAYYRIVGVPAGYTISKADETAFCYDTGEYDIRLDENGNLILYWFTVDVDIDGEGVESSNKENETEKGKDYETKLEPDDDHELPDEIEVWVGDEKLDPDEYEYDSDTGDVRIPGENVDEDITIIVKGDKKHTITVETTNVNADYTTGRITRKNTLTIHFTAANRYALPNEIRVDGTCSYTYDKNIGVLVITEASSDIQVTAKGVEQYVTLYFDANGGTCDTASKQITWSQATLGELPVPERTGYSFTGWFTVSETRVTANTENNLTEDLYLTAVWAAKTNIAYTVRHWVEHTESGLNPAYDGGTLHVVGESGNTTSYYLYEEAVYENGRADGGLNLVPFLKEYFIDADGILGGIGLPASSRNEYHGIISPDSSSVFNLYYDRQHYTITFDGNKGIVLGEAKKDIVYGSIYSAMPSAERAGYDFTGWYTDANAGELVQAGDLYLTEGNQTLYAHWEPRGDIEIKVYHYTQDFDSYTNQPATSYTEHSYTTINGTAGATVDIHGIAIAGFKPADNNVYEFYVDPEGSLAANLYYDRIITTIHFDSNGGSEIISRYLFAYGAKLLSFPNDPVKTGYDFNGWYLGKEETARKIVYGDELNDINPEIKTELTFYAHWKAKTYELPLEANGGKVLDANGQEIQSITVTYDKRIGEIPDAERVGHCFMGWQDANGNEVTADTVVTTETIIDVIDGVEVPKTIYAQYDPMKFTVTFDATEGTLMGDSSIIVTYDKAFGDAGKFPAAARTGYTFEGWFFADGSEFKAADKCKLLDDVTVYAHWTPNTYQVSFDVNGGNALDKDYIIVTYDDVYPALPVPTRTGYTFAGWQGDDGIKAGETVKITGPKTLKAKWTPLSFTITFDPNSGTCATETMTVTYDQPYGTLPAATRSNYKLNGWYTAATGGTQITNSTIVKIVADTTLYAQWSADTGGNTGGGGGGGGGSTTYTITATADSGVVITPEGKTSVSSGGSQEYIIKVEDGYTIIDVLVDGESIGVAEKYTFEKVSKNHTIHVEAKKDSILTGDHIAYVAGYEDGTVRPDANITRAETSMIFYRLLTDSAKSTSSKLTFSDIGENEWYTEAVSTLVGAGILTGYSDGTFRADASITRAEFAAIASRFDNLEPVSTNQFADIAGHWAADSINRAAKRGWINGYPDGTFRPDQTITRAEAMSLINNILERKVDAHGLLSGMQTFSDNMNINAWYYYIVQEAANGHDFEKDSEGMETWTELH